MNPGIYPDLPIDDYHGDVSSISKTGLDAIAHAPAMYFAKYLDPNRPPERERVSQLEGSLAHCALLEPDQFALRYVSIPPNAPRRPTDAQWNAKAPSDSSLAAMAWWRDFNAANGSKIVITDDQRRAALAQAESMRRISSVRRALDHEFATEVSAYAVDEPTSVTKRVRPDLLSRFAGGTILFDVKTFGSAAPADFERQVDRMRYFVQAPYYTDVYAEAANVDVQGFVFVVVETEYPYLAAAMMLDEDSLTFGRNEYRRNLVRFAECSASGVWPGYGDDVTLISLPQWRTRKEEA